MQRLYRILATVIKDVAMQRLYRILATVIKGGI